MIGVKVNFFFNHVHQQPEVVPVCLSVSLPVYQCAVILWVEEVKNNPHAHAATINRPRCRVMLSTRTKIQVPNYHPTMTTTAGDVVDEGGNMGNENTAPNAHVTTIGEATNEGQQIDIDGASSLTALSLFKSQIRDKTSTSKRLTCQRQAYEDRLRSFHAVNYMFKPACLSPIICARFG